MIKNSPEVFGSMPLVYIVVQNAQSPIKCEDVNSKIINLTKQSDQLTFTELVQNPVGYYNK